MSYPVSNTYSTMTLTNMTDQPFLTLNSIDATDSSLYYEEAAVAIPKGQTATILNYAYGSAKLVFNLTQQMLVEIELNASDGKSGTVGSATCAPVVTGGTEYVVIGDTAPKPVVTKSENVMKCLFTFDFTVQRA